MGEMSVMGTSQTLKQLLGNAEWVKGGDTKIIWASDRDDEVDNARATFERLRARGYRAFSVDRSGGQGEQVDRFDPTVEKLIFVPPMRGGER